MFANVDEADIGLIRQAQARNEQVRFEVDAYPDDEFTGVVTQVRMNPTTTQNVVTYPVVVEAPNPELKLMPGMTANLTFHVERREDVLRIPNSALRFYPKIEHVRKQDRDLLEGDDEQYETGNDEREASNRQTRHVWIVEDDLLNAVEVTTGVSDGKYTELMTGEIEKGSELVTGIRPKGP